MSYEIPNKIVPELGERPFGALNVMVAFVMSPTIDELVIIVGSVTS